MHTVHIDHLGPFVKSSKGNSYLIIAVDGFTKYLWAKAVSSTKTGPLVKFCDETFAIFGVPYRIICDRGTCYTSKVFQDYTKRLGIRVVRNATATPRANGQVERYNRTILASLSATADDERKWDNVIGSIRFGINSAVQSVTAKSPHDLLFGYKPKGIHDAFLAHEVEQNENVDNDMSTAREEAARRITAAQSKQKAYYDAKRKKPIVYDVGMQVLLRRSANANDGKSKKLLPKYSGPYVVTKVLDHDRYLIDIPGARRARKKYQGICPADKLKPYTATHDCSSNDSNSGSDVELVSERA